jgi:hypothetical protein
MLQKSLLLAHQSWEYAEVISAHKSALVSPFFNLRLYILFLKCNHLELFAAIILACVNPAEAILHT